MPTDEPTHQPRRVIAGHCPKCLQVVVIFNNHEVWPLVHCKCGWAGATTAIHNHTRLETHGVIRAH